MSSFQKDSKLRITELSNEQSKFLNVLDEKSFRRCLQQIDNQIFDSWSGFAGIVDVEFLNQLKKVSNLLALKLKKKSNEKNKSPLIVLMGCGTSGRM